VSRSAFILYVNDDHRKLLLLTRTLHSRFNTYRTVFLRVYCIGGDVLRCNV
jgi:hypothetical protein